MIDYLIVGSGLAGIAFAETAAHHQKSFLVIDGNLQSSSNVAGGLYNPVILKRFTALAQADEQLQTMHDFYSRIESKLGQQFDFRLPVLRKFASVEEQNNWFIAADKPGMEAFLATELVPKKYSGIDSPFDYGKVNDTGYVDVSRLLEEYKTYLSTNNLLLTEIFDYNQLEINPTGIKYKNTQAANIIFAEGFGMHANPFFKELPLDGAKGELLIIKAPGLSLDVILNTNVFILPLGNDLFKIGATYNWTDKTDVPTEEAKAELIEKLRELLTCDFEVMAHHAGVRPTVKDRKALIGTHTDFSKVHILNGLGTRGVMLGPAMAKTLFEHIEFGTPFPRDIDIKRFDKKK
jgi:glycine oxidase